MASTMWLMQNGMQDPENALSSASDYLNLVALTSLTYMWARMAKFSDGKMNLSTRLKLRQVLILLISLFQNYKCIQKKFSLVNQP